MDDDRTSGPRGLLRRALARRLRERWQGAGAGPAMGTGAGLGALRRQALAEGDEDGAAFGTPRFDYEPAAGIERLADLAYGSHPRQCVDVYRLASAARADTAGIAARRGAPAAALAPVLVVVHGGGWANGDKRHVPSIARRVDHWCSAGWIVVAVNYRFVPDADPREQAGDLAHAITFVQSHAPAWGGDPRRVVLMGHSAGAHLAALASADAALRDAAGAEPWAATIALDGAALDVVRLMSARHLPLFERAFGADPQRWREASPTLVMNAPPPMPMLMVCSARRADSCAQAHAFAQRARALGATTGWAARAGVEVLAVELGHAQINAMAGASGVLTDAIDAFVARALGAEV